MKLVASVPIVTDKEQSIILFYDTGAVQRYSLTHGHVTQLVSLPNTIEVCAANPSHLLEQLALVGGLAAGVVLGRNL